MTAQADRLVLVERLRQHRTAGERNVGWREFSTRLAHSGIFVLRTTAFALRALRGRNWHCFTLSHYDRHTGKWELETAPVHHIID